MTIESVLGSALLELFDTVEIDNVSVEFDGVTVILSPEDSDEEVE